MTPEEFGERIRAHREAKGLGIEELASRFKLSRSAVRAIEEGSLRDLPHAVYAKGFIRAYAQAVDLPPDELAAGLEALFPEEAFTEPPAPLRFAVKPSVHPGQPGRVLAGICIILVVLALLGGAAWLVYSNFISGETFVAQPFSALKSPSGEGTGEAGAFSAAAPPAQASAQAPPVAPPADPSARAAAQNVEDASMSPPAGDAPAAQAVTASETPGENASSQAEPASVSPVSGNHIVVRATEECWVQLSADDEGTRTFTIYPGESSILPYKRRLAVVLGNTGGVSITHNGKDYPVNGKKNEKRTIIFQ